MMFHEWIGAPREVFMHASVIAAICFLCAYAETRSLLGCHNTTHRIQNFTLVSPMWDTLVFVPSTLCAALAVIEQRTIYRSCVL